MIVSAERAQMKIAVNRIPSEGLHEEGRYDPSMMDIERFDVHPADAVTVSAFFTKADTEVVVQAEITCPVELCCARCLEPFERPLKTSGMYSYEIGAPTDVIDITEDVRQEIILAYPMVPVCREACKGLCPACGQNLNETTCEHQAR